MTPLTENAQPITVETPVRIETAFWNYVPGTSLNFSIVLYNIEGVAIFNTGSFAA